MNPDPDCGAVAPPVPADAGSAEPASAHAAPAAGPAAVRRRRAAVARRLQAGAPQAAARVDWKTLAAAPAWLALGDDDLARLASRAGAMQHAPLMRMWIDAGRLAAAAAALGDEFLQCLLTLPEAQMPLPPDLLQGPAIGTAEQVAPVLRATGQGVLLAALPSGPLRHAVAACWSPVEPCSMAEEVAGMLIARVQWLASHLQAEHAATTGGVSDQRAGAIPLPDATCPPHRPTGVAA